MRWQYQYALPTQPYCIRVRSTDGGNNAKFAIGMDERGNRVLYSDEGTVSIEYTARVDDVGAWSPLAVQVLIKIMASKLAKPVTGQNSTAELKLKEAYALLPEARASDSVEGSPPTLRPNTRLLTARHRWGGTWGPRWRQE